MTRRYRMTPEGEKPVWASKKRIEQWGREEGARAARENRLPIHMANPTHDRAADAEYERITGKKVPT